MASSKLIIIIVLIMLIFTSFIIADEENTEELNQESSESRVEQSKPEEKLKCYNRCTKKCKCCGILKTPTCYNAATGDSYIGEQSGFGTCINLQCSNCACCSTTGYKLVCR